MEESRVVPRPWDWSWEGLGRAEQFDLHTYMTFKYQREDVAWPQLVLEKGKPREPMPRRATCHGYWPGIASSPVLQERGVWHTLVWRQSMDTSIRSSVCTCWCRTGCSSWGAEELSVHKSSPARHSEPLQFGAQKKDIGAQEGVLGSTTNSHVSL